MGGQQALVRIDSGKKFSGVMRRFERLYIRRFSSIGKNETTHSLRVPEFEVPDAFSKLLHRLWSEARCPRTLHSTLQCSRRDQHAIKQYLDSSSKSRRCELCQDDRSNDHYLKFLMRLCMGRVAKPDNLTLSSSPTLVLSLPSSPRLPRSPSRFP